MRTGLFYASWILVCHTWPFISGAQAAANEPTQHATVELLPPTGPFPLGRTSYHWVDASRQPPGAEHGTKSEVMVHIWYPATPSTNSMAAAYIPGFSTIQAAIGEAKLKREAGGYYDALRAARTHVAADADVRLDAGYPVILLTHGLRFNALGYSMLGEDLASHGYVVVGIDHPSTAFAVLFPDNRVTRFSEELWTQPRTSEETLAFEQRNVNHCAADLTFVLNQLTRLNLGALASPFKGRLDLSRVGVLGHSFGGRVAARACQLDMRLKAGLLLDSFGRKLTVDKNPDRSTIEQPMMIQYARRVPAGGIPRLLALLQTPGLDLEGELRRVRKEFCESVKGVSYEVVLDTPGIIHESFSDMPLLESGQTEDSKRNRCKAMEYARSYTRAFFDRHVRSLPAPLLDHAPDNPREVELTRHTFRGQ
jgi:dienelactone hydrolase